MTALMQLQNVYKSDVALNALHDVSISIPAGETFGLIGLNGAGKTTLIKCILDLQQVNRSATTISGTISTNKVVRGQPVYLPERFAPPKYVKGYTQPITCF